jgi:lipopolysaccharide/colanic/teichoic acid biosynthesis glycosyltransferase
MNNSELSIIASPADAFTEPRTYDYRHAWDNSPENLSPSNIPLHKGCHSDGTAEIECLGTIAVHGRLDRQTIQVRSRLERAKRLDLGLWLLCGSAVRQSQWEHLQEKSQSAATKVQDFSMKCSPAIKRSCDVVGSLFLLTVLSPLFILMAIVIKLDSPGPVLFRHYRVGKGGKEFLLWKFRSMKVNVPKYAVSPQSATDGRLTRIGRLIRRLSIDEIPQLINVLKGEMSLVGPRPEMPFIVESYRAVEYVRFAVRPGITGLWQISPARAFPIHENLQYDFHYIHNQNLALDCAIILRTISAVIHGIGAV